jgi:hypothetical protein
MKTYKTIIVLLLLAFIPSINAQFKIDAQYRVRGQLLHGYKVPVSEDVDPAFHIGQRTRLNLKYINKENKFSSLLSIQDVRVWGDENIVNPTGVQGKSYNTIDVYEAWFCWHINEKSKLKIGRQEMKYDDQRHISWRNWWDRGQTYDAILYSRTNKETGWRIDLSASYNSKKADLLWNNYSDGTIYFGNVNPILTQEFIYVKKQVNPKFYVSFTAIAAGYQKEGSVNTVYVTGTEGIHANYNATKKNTDGLFFKGNLFLQHGKNISGKDISAHMITGMLGYRTMNKKLELSGIFEYLSGDDAANTDPDYLDTDHTYNLLYGARHPYYEGYLDWFVVPKSTLNAGLMNMGIKVKYKVTKKDILEFGFSNVRIPNNAKKLIGGNWVQYDSGTVLTNNIDFTYIRKVNSFIKWMNGISYGAPSDEFLQMKGISDSGTNYFAYSMLIVTPKLLDSTNK